MLGGKITVNIPFYIIQYSPGSYHFTLSCFQVSKLHLLIDMATASYDKYFFGDVGRETYDFFWGDFADWYVTFDEVVFH